MDLKASENLSRFRLHLQLFPGGQSAVYGTDENERAIKYIAYGLACNQCMIETVEVYSLSQ